MHLQVGMAKKFAPASRDTDADTDADLIVCAPANIDTRY